MRDLPKGKLFQNAKTDKYVQQRFDRELSVVQEEFKISKKVREE